MRRGTASVVAAILISGCVHNDGKSSGFSYRFNAPRYKYVKVYDIELVKWERNIWGSKMTTMHGFASDIKSQLERGFSENGYVVMHSEGPAEKKLMAVKCTARINKTTMWSDLALDCDFFDVEKSVFVFRAQGRSSETNAMEATKQVVNEFGVRPRPRIIPVEVDGYSSEEYVDSAAAYDQALAMAKLRAIEYGGISIKSWKIYYEESGPRGTFDEYKKYIESKAAGVLLDGYRVVRHGYQQNGRYRITLIGEVYPEE